MKKGFQLFFPDPDCKQSVHTSRQVKWVRRVMFCDLAPLSRPTAQRERGPFLPYLVSVTKTDTVPGREGERVEYSGGGGRRRRRLGREVSLCGGGAGGGEVAD